MMDKDIHSSSSAFGKGGLGLRKSLPSLFLLTLLLHLFRRHRWLVKFVSHHRVEQRLHTLFAAPIGAVFLSVVAGGEMEACGRIHRYTQQLPLRDARS